MNLAAVITHLRQHAPIFEGRVAGAADFEVSLVGEGAMKLPAAYVVPLVEDAEPNDMANELRQLVTETVAVIVEFSNAADRRGQTVTDQYDVVRQQLWHALLNWRLDPVHAARGLEYGGGSKLESDRARLFYQWTFTQELTITAADGWPVDAEPLVTIDSTYQAHGHTLTEAVTTLPQTPPPRHPPDTLGDCHVA